MYASEKLPLQPAPAAANQDFPPASWLRREAKPGWDPYEVWRRMIKEPRDRRLAQPS